MKTKKTIALLLACVLCLALFAACGKTETPDDGQNPVMNIIGNYINDRVSATIEAVGEKDAKVTAYWGDTARDGFSWELTGTFDEATMRINYSNAVKKSVTYTDVDVTTVNEILFDNGKGYIQINDDGTLTWNDEQDPDMSFEPLEFVPVADDDVTAPADEQPNDEENTVSEATPLKLEDTLGDYVCGRCNITVEAGDEGDLKFSIHWGGSAFESYDWTMSGYYDADTWRVNYTGAVKTLTVFDEDGNETESKVEYDDGYGRMQFVSDNQLLWQDEVEMENVRDMVFVKN
jgi:hypothetical protein